MNAVSTPDASPPAPSRFETLLSAARAGDTEALGQLLDAFRRYLTGLGFVYIRPDLRPKGSASDLVQETYVAATRAFPQFRGNSSEEMWAWLRMILFRHLSSFRRRYVGRTRQYSLEVSLDDERCGDLVRQNLAARNPGPSAEAIHSEQNNRLAAAIQSLPSAYRRIVVMHMREGRSFVNIGLELGFSAEAIRKTWTRAIRTLTKALDRDKLIDRSKCLDPTIAQQIPT
jgi:RNA polymerase sigma-70 factor (ECF subfamily)